MPMMVGLVGRPKTANANVAVGGIWNIQEQYNQKVTGLWTRNIPTYSIVANLSVVNEGTSVGFAITTTDKDNGDILYWTNSGNTVAADFTQNINSGNITLQNNAASLVLTLSNDITTETTETAIISIRTGSTSGPIVATANTVTVLDTSITPTYQVFASSATIAEGQTITFTVSTVGIPDTTTFYYTLSGVTADDISGGATSGSFTVSSNAASIPIALLTDLLTENETITFQMRTGSTSGNIVATASSSITDVPVVIYSAAGTYSAPVSSGTYVIKLWGAGGGGVEGGQNGMGSGGGGGAVVSQNISIGSSQTWTVYVGGGGGRGAQNGVVGAAGPGYGAGGAGGSAHWGGSGGGGSSAVSTPSNGTWIAAGGGGGGGDGSKLGYPTGGGTGSGTGGAGSTTPAGPAGGNGVNGGGGGGGGAANYTPGAYGGAGGANTANGGTGYNGGPGARDTTSVAGNNGDTDYLDPAGRSGANSAGQPGRVVIRKIA